MGKEMQRASGLFQTDVQYGNSWEDNEPHPDAPMSALASSALITDRQVGQSGLMQGRLFRQSVSFFQGCNES